MNELVVLPHREREKKMATTPDERPANNQVAADTDCSAVRKSAPTVRYWHNGPKDGLSVPVFSSRGDVWHAATPGSADAFVRALNYQQTSSDFGAQCWQDQCENAHIEASVHKRVVRAAATAVIAFGSDSEGEAIAALGRLLADNVYATESTVRDRGSGSVDPSARESGVCTAGHSVESRERDD